MYAIAFELNSDVLRKELGNTYYLAYDDIRQELESLGFEWIIGSVYVTNRNSLTSVYKAITRLSNIDWIKKSIRNVKSFRVEDISDFTEIIRK